MNVIAFDASIADESSLTISRLKEEKNGSRLWTDGNIETVLRMIADRLDRFPTDRELHYYGLGGARKQIRSKGLQYWGERIGRQVRKKGEWTPEQQEAAKVWTDETIATRLRELHQGREVLMGIDELQASKYPGLAAAVSRRGRPFWAEQLGLELLFERWNDQTLEAKLKEFLGNKEHFPSQREFKETGEERLHAALRRHHGVEYWVKWSGLPRARPGRPQNSNSKIVCTRWTDQKIGAYLDELLIGWDHFPSQREFKEAGIGHLPMVMQRHHGIAYWVKRSGLPRATSGNRVRRRSYSDVCR